MFKLMMVSGGIKGLGSLSSEYYDTSEIWTGTEWRLALGKLPYTARDVRMAFIDNRILYLGKKDYLKHLECKLFKRWMGFKNQA